MERTQYCGQLLFQKSKSPSNAEALNVVGDERFELPTLWSQTRCANHRNFILVIIVFQRDCPLVRLFQTHNTLPSCANHRNFLLVIIVFQRGNPLVRLFQTHNALPSCANHRIFYWYLLYFRGVTLWSAYSRPTMRYQAALITENLS